MLLEVNGLTKKYPEHGVIALEGVTFSMEEGEILGIAGESGAGKSTLLKILRGVESFDSGTISFDNLKISPNSPKSDLLELQKLTAIQLQRSFGLWPDSAVDNVIRAIRYSDGFQETIPEGEGEYREYRERAMEILKVVGLERRAELWSEVLSGGEKQRLIIARQIARKPRLLLLDEPGTMTCPATREALLDALKRANRELGTAILFASHNPQIHRSLSVRTILIDKGRVVDDGKTEAVLSKFLSRLEAPVRKVKLDGKVVLKMEGASKVYKLIPYGMVFEMTETNLEFKRGEITGIVGPSGAGKTVILRMLSGLEIPDKGEVKITYKGEWVVLGRLGRKNLMARRRIGILHQEFDLPHFAKVLDLFAAKLGLKDYGALLAALKRAERSGISDEVVDALSRVSELPEGEMKAKLDEMGMSQDLLRELFKTKDPEKAKSVAVAVLEAVGLGTNILERHVYELSGGEKIRVALALSLVANPKVLILDEPFGDLDPITLRTVANSLKMVKEKFRPAIVLVSHQLDLLEEVSDRAILMLNGRVVMDGDPSSVVKRLLEEEGIEF
ncbi:MAG: ATP-binding cassette domain-containing protein [Candidatus Verstraetearchaeota archaeon]|nr:ATP-binding cassette domain-containing protein [Candidatus Verstraetearchaeota archaeon]